MQLADLHYNFSTDWDKEKAYLHSLFEASKPSLVMLSGDNVLNASKITVGNLLDLLNSLCKEYGAYYGLTWGNHDKEGFYDPSYWNGECQKRDRCVYFEATGDNVYGRANYVLNLTDGNKTCWQVYSIDSNSLIGKDSISYNYDIIHEDQVKWFEEESDLAKTNDAYVPSLVYFHIPLWETEYAYRLAGLNSEVSASQTEGKLYGYSGEMDESIYFNSPVGSTKVWGGYKNSGFFKSAESKGVKGIFFGHDHKSDFVAKYATKDSPRDETNAIVIGYGLKSSGELSYKSTMIGAFVATIKKDGSASYARYFQQYSSSYDNNSVKVEELSL